MSAMSAVTSGKSFLGTRCHRFAQDNNNNIQGLPPRVNCWEPGDRMDPRVSLPVGLLVLVIMVTGVTGEGIWLRRDSSWVVDSTGTPWVDNGVTYDAAKALDGDTGTYWNVIDTGQNYNNWYIVLDIAAPQTLTRVAVNSQGDTTHDIAAFKLQSSQVGSPYSWEDVVSVDNVQGGTDQRQEFGGFQGTARYWRFVVTRTHGGWQPYLTELNLYSISPGIWLRRDSSWVVDSTGTPWVDNGVTYDAAKALDGDTGTNWNVIDTSQNYNNWYIVLDIAAPQTLTRVAVNSQGDTTHDIAAFKLQSSQVGSPYSWEDVVSVDNVQGGTDQRQEFGGFQGTARYWRFVVTRTHGGWQPYLTELNLYSISPAVSDLTFHDIETDQMTLSWTASANVTRYRLHYRHAGSSNRYLSPPPAPGDSNATVRGLWADTEYNFTLTAFGEDDEEIGEISGTETTVADVRQFRLKNGLNVRACMRFLRKLLIQQTAESAKP
ncbi:hypothetical protein Bbelb_082130 [Branchiostoma belcheri]|nr:hypothetical protein Bbelb_082130 [Branchiostoma belcheri]